LLEPDLTAMALLDAGEHVLERRLLGQALQLCSEVLLKRLASLLGPSLELGVNVLRKVSHQNIRHAYSMIATLDMGKGLYPRRQSGCSRSGAPKPGALSVDAAPPIAGSRMSCRTCRRGDHGGSRVTGATARWEARAPL